MSIKNFNIKIDQGCSWNMDLYITDSLNSEPISLTGYSCKGQIRQSYADNSPLQFTEITCSITPNSNLIELSISANETQLIDYTSGVYDIELTDPNNFTERLLSGKVTIFKEVTRN